MRGESFVIPKRQREKQLVEGGAKRGFGEEVVAVATAEAEFHGNGEQESFECTEEGSLAHLLPIERPFDGTHAPARQF